VNPAKAVDLSVEIGALHVANPVIAASGTFGYGIEFANLTDLNRLGAIVVKGLSLEPMEGAPSPRLVPTPAGMINAVGLQNVGVRRFISEKLPALQSYRAPVIANVFGRTVEEYAEVVRHLEGAEGVAAYELNISCPNVACGGIQFGSNAQQSAQVVAAARKVSRTRRRRRRPNCGQHISSNERRLQDPRVAHRKPDRGAIGPGHQTDHTSAGL
jgi:dihydroorotate dehydrogenase (NAD+) catalytic subunit